MFSNKLYGTALVIRWDCVNGHSCGSWASQPKMKRMFSGNLQLATNTLLTGNSYRKVAQLFSYMNLGCIGENTYYQVQKLYAVPAVNKYWQSMQAILLAEKQRLNQEVRIAGDGRNDSPGHSSQFCTYSFADMESGAILHVEVVDVRQSTSSVAMEKLGFIQALEFLLCKVKVVEVVTDQNPSITKLMREHAVYRTIEHQYDLWHAAKNLEKRLIAACKPRSLLRHWVSSIKNHFWWSSQTCEGTTVKMKETWVRVLSHVCNVQEWQVAGHTDGRCSHAPINEASDRHHQWLDKKSIEMDSLRQVVTEPRFLKQFPYFRLFRHTGSLESYHSHILMYCPKRHSYQFQGYRARNLLAAIDHNHHLYRLDLTNNDGDVIYHGSYSKRSQCWRPKKDKVDKDYSYRYDLQLLAFQEKERETENMKRKVRMEADDPRLISSTIAKRPCPPLSELMKETVSRFNEL